ncbi:NADP-binding protein [Dacryopinax primogenitus]|uniref:NADP-binding protein n=1 Tax=Dacryopinax primogenitus (strain DJM 731) TaxID=1858805 RepID=M5GG50_DACPD|nr:NADP-binding protein [Dacryopinax primogenitus]EJU04873.1 NADP-binding protein [Dacryopinax primogenitus]
MSTLPKIVVIGGTGAQGVPAVQALSESGRFEVVVLTRNKSSESAQSLASLPHVSLFEGTYLKESDVWALFKDAYGAFVNTDGFVIGEKAEIFWGMRIFEIAVAQGVKHYVWGNLYYLTKLGHYYPKYRSGHMDAKARVAEWLLAQKLPNITVTLFTTCPYANMFWDGMFHPIKMEDGSFVFHSSIGNGHLPLIALEDVGTYVQWIFDNKSRADNLDLVAVTDIPDYPTIISAFEKVTGKKAHWVDLPYDEYAAIRQLKDDVPAAWAHGSGEYNDPAGMSLKANFSGWWQSFRDDTFGWDKVDTKLLDEINPGRIRSFEEWCRKVGYNGENRIVLKDRKDKSFWERV